jgi:hypothetical protein
MDYRPDSARGWGHVIVESIQMIHAEHRVQDISKYSERESTK